MPDVKTSDETAASALDGTELARIVQGGNSRKATLVQIKTYTDGGMDGASADADFTLQVGIDGEFIRHTGTLTADRAVTLSTTDAYAGARFWITRMSSGAFNLTFATTPSATLAQDEWGLFVYNGTFWFLAAKGAL